MYDQKANNKIEFETANENFLVVVDTEILYSIMDRHTPMSTPTQRGKSVYMTKEAIRVNNAKYRAWKRLW